MYWDCAQQRRQDDGSTLERSTTRSIIAAHCHTRSTSVKILNFLLQMNSPRSNFASRRVGARNSACVIVIDLWRIVWKGAELWKRNFCLLNAPCVYMHHFSPNNIVKLQLQFWTIKYRLLPRSFYGTLKIPYEWLLCQFCSDRCSNYF